VRKEVIYPFNITTLSARAVYDDEAFTIKVNGGRLDESGGLQIPLSGLGAGSSLLVSETFLLQCFGKKGLLGSANPHEI
jgi:hypothetical protein